MQEKSEGGKSISWGNFNNKFNMIQIVVNLKYKLFSYPEIKFDKTFTYLLIILIYHVTKTSCTFLFKIIGRYNHEGNSVISHTLRSRLFINNCL